MPTYELDPDCVAVIGRMEAWQRRLEAKIDLMLTKVDGSLGKLDQLLTALAEDEEEPDVDLEGNELDGERDLKEGL